MLLGLPVVGTISFQSWWHYFGPTRQAERGGVEQGQGDDWVRWLDPQGREHWN